MNVKIQPHKKYIIFSTGFFLLFSLLYFFISVYLFQQHGPTWIYLPNDMDYVNLLNGLNILVGNPSSLLVHPDITTVYSYAVLIYIAHLFVGSGPIVHDVMLRPEMYMSIILYVYWVIAAVSLFYLAKATYDYTRSFWLAALTQLYFLIFIRDYLALYLFNSGAAEHVQLICSILMVALSLKCLSMRVGKGRIIVLSILAVLAFAAKFTGIIFLLFPFLIMPGWRLKKFYIFISILFILIFFLPLFKNFIVFGAQIAGVISEILREPTYTKNASCLRIIFSDILSIGTMGCYLPLFVLDIIICIALSVGRLIKKTLCFPVELKFMWACVIIAILSLLMFASRPKIQYLSPYLIFYVMPILVLLAVTWRNISIEIFRKILASLFFVMLCFSFYLIYSSIWVVVPFFVKNKMEVMYINRLVHKQYAHSAVITAIAASNLTVGFRHAFDGFPKEIGKVLPKNVFLYNLYTDRNTYFNHNSRKFTLNDIFRRYRHIVFHTENFNFQNFFDPDLRFIPIYHGRYESLQTINQVPGSIYKPSVSKINKYPDVTFLQTQPNCVTLKFDGSFPYVVNGYVLFFAKSVGAHMSVTRHFMRPQRNLIQVAQSPIRMQREFSLPVLAHQYYLHVDADTDFANKFPLSWKLTASNDNVHWYLLDKKVNQPVLYINRIKYFSIKHPKTYRLYRLLLLSPHQPHIFHISKWSVYVVRRYHWGLAYHQDRHFSLMPKRWVVKASNDGRHWKVLDKQLHPKAWKAGDRERYVMNNHRYYRQVEFCSLNPNNKWVAAIRPLYRVG